MSSWASIELGDQTILETQNHFGTWYFRKSERVIEHDLVEDAKSYKFVMSGTVLLRRLELDGHNRASLRKEFDLQLESMKKDCRDMMELDPNGRPTGFLPVLEQSTLDDWLKRLRRIVEENLVAAPYGQPDKDFGDPLLNFMMSVEGYFFSDSPGAGGHHFPCRTHEAYAVALLEVLPEDASCILDVTALVEAGWTSAFDDLVEFNQEFTKFYEVFRASIDEITSLTSLAPENKALARMLYAAVISSLETYLSDTLRKQVFVRPAIKRRFVETHGKFKGNHLDLRDIYVKLENLDNFISEVIDSESFHNIVSVGKLYKIVLLTEVPKQHMDKLVKAVSLRHDIVHRNGKTTKGEVHLLTMVDVTKLVADVDAAVRHIDKQIKDGLLDDADESDPLG